MANKHTTLNSLFTAIADAIRTKNNSADDITADNFPIEIENLRTGFDYVNNNVTAIADYEFKNCTDLLSVDCINIESIGVSAFEGCANLKRVVLYDGVASVGENAFKGCSKDLIIYYKGSSIPATWHENWNPDNYIVLLGDLVNTWDISATSEDSVTAELYNNIDKGKYSLLIKGRGNMVNYEYQSNAWYAYRTNINSIVVLNGVKNIGDRAFQECSSLKVINISNSVSNIGLRAFEGCANLTSIMIPNSMKIIGTGAFNTCTNLSGITIPDNVTSIGDAAFYQCHSLTSVNIPNSITSIDALTFYECKGLTSITIPDSIISIGEYALGGCSKLTSITYTGTRAQWNAITLGSYWNKHTSNYTIHCLDGNISKDGTITPKSLEEVTSNG